MNFGTGIQVFVTCAEAFVKQFIKCGVLSPLMITLPFPSDLVHHWHVGI